jgi:hypothetical protein
MNLREKYNNWKYKSNISPVYHFKKKVKDYYRKNPTAEMLSFTLNKEIQSSLMGLTALIMEPTQYGAPGLIVCAANAFGSLGNARPIIKGIFGFMMTGRILGLTKETIENYVSDPALESSLAMLATFAAGGAVLSMVGSIITESEERKHFKDLPS